MSEDQIKYILFNSFFYRSQNAYDAALVFENEDELTESRYYTNGNSLLRTMDTQMMESMWSEKVGSLIFAEAFKKKFH